jgi:MinD superfamily P-loop ATPase
LTKKISIVSYESSIGRTTLAKGLFEYASSLPGVEVQLLGYDIEKPDLIQLFDKVKLNAEEVYAGFPKIDNQRCKFCGACVSYCDCGALQLYRHVPAIVLDPEKCEACGDCIQGCSLHGISTKERLTGYILHGQINGNSITIGKADDSHNFLVPLICTLNLRKKPESIAVCDMGPGVSGYVLTAVKNSTLAIIVLKPARGWKRNIEFLLDMFEHQKIPVGIVINKYREEQGFLNEVEDFCSIGNIQLLGILPYFLSDKLEKSLDTNAIGSENESIFAPIWNKVVEY